MKRTPWARIYEAGLNGTGCRLSAEDCAQLRMDDAIVQRGSEDLDAFKAGRDPYEEPTDAHPSASRAGADRERTDA